MSRSPFSDFQGKCWVLLWVLLSREGYRAARRLEDEQEVYRRRKTARQTDLRVMLAGPKGRAVGESGELDEAVRKGEGKLGVVSASLPLLAQEDP
eukprot:1177025-Prorocentrum_minimum.AAC.2